MKEKVRVIIADDHDLIRQGIKHVIEVKSDFIIIEEARNGQEALDFTVLLQPDLLIIDMNMPLLTGLQVLEALSHKKSETKVIVLTIENHKEVIEKCMALGADGYILKDSVGTEIVRAIYQVLSGDKYIDPALIGLLFDSVQRKKVSTNPLDHLTDRECDILYQMTLGKSNKEIGETLFLAEKTVKNYSTTIFKKLDVKDRVNAVLFAIEHDISRYIE